MGSLRRALDIVAVVFVLLVIIPIWLSLAIMDDLIMNLRGLHWDWDPITRRYRRR